jgi:hypothetical protein
MLLIVNIKSTTLTDIQDLNTLSDSSSFSSGIYSLTNSEAYSCSSDSDSDQTQCSHFQLSSQQSPSQPSEQAPPKKQPVITTSQQGATEPRAQPPPNKQAVLTEIEEIGTSAADDEMHVSDDSDSDQDMDTNKRVQHLLKRGAARYGSIQLEHNSKGNKR